MHIQLKKWNYIHIKWRDIALQESQIYAMIHGDCHPSLLEYLEAKEWLDLNKYQN
jgi:hypothetical protein